MRAIALSLTHHVNRRQVAALLAVLAGACVLWSLAGSWLSASFQVLLWVIWVGMLVVVWRWSGRSLFGPVLFYDMVRMGRRKRYVLLRTLYAVFLFLLVFWVYNLVALSRLDGRAQAARLASDFFETLMIVQLGVVLVLTPAYLGGAVAEEKERRTLEFILATDLTNHEIVLSKLGSRLASIALFLLTALPIVSFMQFLGGIDPNLVLAGFAVTGLTMLGVGSVSLLYSVLMRRSRDAIASTYLFLLAYLAISIICWGITMTVGWRSLLERWLSSWIIDEWGAWACVLLTEALNAGSPLALAIRCGQAGRSGSLASALPPLLRDYATFHLLLSGACLALATLRLRSVGLKQTVGREIKPKEKTADSKPIGERPMLWKEMLESRARLGLASWFALIGLIGLTLGIGIWIWVEQLLRPNSNGIYLAESMNLWARVTAGAVACLGLLRAAIRASTSISGERDQQTLDALIISGLDSNAILGAKLIGSVLSVRVGFYWLAAILFLGCITGGVHPGALALTLAAWIVYAFCFAAIGLFCSMACSTSTRASVATALISIGLAVGHWFLWICLGPFFVTAGIDWLANTTAKVQVGMSPPCVLILFMFPWGQVRFAPNDDVGDWLIASLAGLAVWGAGAFFCWHVLLLPQFQRVMRRTAVYPEGRGTGSVWH
jgi:ABC-type transport system involved in multi-copper enzyme maturation permease subunit